VRNFSYRGAANFFHGCDSEERDTERAGLRVRTGRAENHLLVAADARRNQCLLDILCREMKFQTEALGASFIAVIDA